MFFSLQVATYIAFTGDVKFLSENLLMLEKEFLYFENEKTVNVRVNDKTYRMARYIVSSDGPRPESYRYVLYELTKLLHVKLYVIKLTCHTYYIEVCTFHHD